MSPVVTSYQNWADRTAYNEHSFHAEERVRDSGGDDPADLHIAYERAKERADAEAEGYWVPLESDVEYRVHVRVVRSQREAS